MSNFIFANFLLWNVWCRTTDKEIIIFKIRFSLFNLRHQKTQFLQENCLNAQNSFCHNLIKIGWIFLGHDFNANKLLPFFVTFYGFFSKEGFIVSFSRLRSDLVEFYWFNWKYEKLQKKFWIIVTARNLI